MVRSLFNWMTTIRHRRRVVLQVIFIYNSLMVLMGVSCALYFPFLLNSPKGFKEVLSRHTIPYNTQFALVTISACVVLDILLIRALSLFTAENITDLSNGDMINRIREQCINLPFRIFISCVVSTIGVSIPLSVLYFVLVGALSHFFVILTCAVLSLIMFIGILGYIFSNRIFSNILLSTYTTQELQGMRVSIRKKNFLFILPMSLVAILFTSLIGYALVINEKGDILFQVHHNQLRHLFADTHDISGARQLLEKLGGLDMEKKGGFGFVLSPRGETFTTNGSPLKWFFLTYLQMVGDRYGGRSTDVGDLQGAYLRLPSTSGEWVAGVTYQVGSYKTVGIFSLSMVLLLILNVTVLYFFSRWMSDDISRVALSLMKIAEGTDPHLEKNIPITSNDEIGDLVLAFNTIQKLELARLFTIEEAQRIAARDLAMATNVQLAILPGSVPDSAQWDIAFAYKPMAGVSGDLYDFYIIDNVLRGVGLFDVSGHGVSSALVTMIAKSLLFRIFKEKLDQPLSEVMEEANAGLYTEISNAQYFLTGCLLRFTGTAIEYASAGHPLIIKKSGQAINKITNSAGDPPDGFFLGMFDKPISFEVVTFSLESGEYLLIYTDGLIEGFDKAHEEYGYKRLHRSFQDAPTGSAQEVLDSILQDFNNFVDNPEKLHDDLTVIVMKRR